MIILFFIALVAAVIHNLVSINDTQKQIEALGKVFSLREHLCRQKYALAANFLVIVFMGLIAPHVVKVYPATANWLWLFYAGGGYGGSDIFERTLGTTKKRIIELTEQVTNSKSEDSKEEAKG